MREAYIIKPDISFLIGWDTGRDSISAFMDMNLHAIRGKTMPEVVLYQIDKFNPMNPHGLLVAYAEATVMPVDSDFDTFTVGSRGMSYEMLSEEQQRIASWALQQTLDVLRSPGSASWTTRWLDVLKQAAKEGFHPDVPPFGFGDPTSYRLIE